MKPIYENRFFDVYTGWVTWFDRAIEQTKHQISTLFIIPTLISPEIEELMAADAQQFAEAQIIGPYPLPIVAVGTNTYTGKKVTQTHWQQFHHDGVPYKTLASAFEAR